MRVQKSKGTRDLTPVEMERFRFIEGVFRNTCLKWDYKEVRTPTIEYLHLFTSAGTLTPTTLSKVYSFLDWDGWSGERVVLRPDGTIPVARLYIDNMSDKSLAKLFYITNIFIFEQTGVENREKWQCGAEFIGESSTRADVELITMALENLRKIGIENVQVKLSHAGVIRALLSGFKLSVEEQSKAFDRILDGETGILNPLKDQKPELVRLLTSLREMKGGAPGFLKNLKATYKSEIAELAPPLDDFINITTLLTEMGQNFEIDLSSGRGFEYYTGLIFQLYVGDAKVGGGGRYDKLISLLGGEDVPASGFALWIYPIMKLITQPTEQNQKVLVTAATGSVKDAFAIAARIHEAGFVAAIASGDENPYDYRWVLEYLSDTEFTLEDQKSKKTFNLDNIQAVLNKLGGKRAR